MKNSKQIFYMRLLTLTFAWGAGGGLSLQAEADHACRPGGSFVSANGDIQGKDNPAEYTCYSWERPRDYYMREAKYNCCSGWVVLRDPKDYWRSREYDCHTGEKAYNWNKWDVYCD